MLVVPEELCKVGDVCIDIGFNLNSALTTNVPDLFVDSRAAGNTQGGFDACGAHAPTVEAAQTAIERLSAVFGVDADALMLCAFAYSSTDEASAQALKFDKEPEPPKLTQPPTPKPDSPWPHDPPEDPVPSPSPLPSPVPQ